MVIFTYHHVLRLACSKHTPTSIMLRCTLWVPGPRGRTWLRACCRNAIEPCRFRWPSVILKVFPADLRKYTRAVWPTVYTKFGMITLTEKGMFPGAVTPRSHVLGLHRFQIFSPLRTADPMAIGILWPTMCAHIVWLRQGFFSVQFYTKVRF